MTHLPINVRRVVTLIGILALVFIVLEFNRRMEELNQTQVAYAGSNAAVEEWARTDGHYIQEGDLPVVPLGQAGAPPLAGGTPTPIPTQPANWEVWWNLFFGE
jgi:hypothetical protein